MTALPGEAPSEYKTTLKDILRFNWLTSTVQMNFRM